MSHSNRDLIIELKNEFSSLRGEMNQRFDKLETDVAGLKTDVAGLKTDVAGLKMDVAGLKTDVLTINSYIKNENKVKEIKANQFIETIFHKKNISFIKVNPDLLSFLLIISVIRKNIS